MSVVGRNSSLFPPRPRSLPDGRQAGAKRGGHHSSLLFLPGWATDSRVWKYQVEEFLKDYKVITIDLPGHGRGDEWSEPTLRPGVEKVLRFTVHGSRFTEFIGIGWSLGALVLMEVARLYPDAFLGLVLVGAAPRFVNDKTFLWGHPRGTVRQMIKDLKKGFYETLKRFYPFNFTEKELTTPEAKGFIELYQQGKSGLSHGSIVTALEALSKVDLRGTLSEVAVPVLLIHGEKDQVSSLEGGRYLARNLPKARLVVFKDAGHAPFLTRKREFNATVRRFLQGQD